MSRALIAPALLVLSLHGPALAGDHIPKHCDRSHARPANPYGSALVPKAANGALPVEPDNDISGPKPASAKPRRTGARTLVSKSFESC
jgi:hypothetical protein